MEKLCLRCLPSDPNVRKEWMNFIFNEDPDCISKNFVQSVRIIKVLCSLHFTADLFTNKAQFNTGKDDAVLIILDPTVILQLTSVLSSVHHAY